MASRFGCAGHCKSLASSGGGRRTVKDDAAIWNVTSSYHISSSKSLNTLLTFKAWQMFSRVEEFEGQIISMKSWRFVLGLFQVLIISFSLLQTCYWEWLSIIDEIRYSLELPWDGELIDEVTHFFALSACARRRVRTRSRVWDDLQAKP